MKSEARLLSEIGEGFMNESPEEGLEFDVMHLTPAGVALGFGAIAVRRKDIYTIQTALDEEGVDTRCLITLGNGKCFTTSASYDKVRAIIGWDY